jgi:hypothetical protein
MSAQPRRCGSPSRRRSSVLWRHDGHHHRFRPRWVVGCVPPGDASPKRMADSPQAPQSSTTSGTRGVVIATSTTTSRVKPPTHFVFGRRNSDDDGSGGRHDYGYGGDDDEDGCGDGDTAKENFNLRLCPFVTFRPEGKHAATLRRVGECVVVRTLIGRMM